MSQTNLFNFLSPSQELPSNKRPKVSAETVPLASSSMVPAPKLERSSSTRIASTGGPSTQTDLAQLSGMEVAQSVAVIPPNATATKNIVQQTATPLTQSSTAPVASQTVAASILSKSVSEPSDSPAPMETSSPLSSPVASSSPTSKSSSDSSYSSGSDPGPSVTPPAAASTKSASMSAVEPVLNKHSIATTSAAKSSSATAMLMASASRKPGVSTYLFFHFLFFHKSFGFDYISFDAIQFHQNFHSRLVTRQPRQRPECELSVFNNYYD
jgi:hypothetical protein